MINLRHINGLIDHQDQVVPGVAACIPDSSINNLCLVFYIYGRFWSLSAKWSPKNGLYNIVYGHLEKTNKILNVSNLKM